MKIEYLEIEGFKSAVNIVLRDVPPFTALAGSNGAGKSNITDALAFLGAVVKRGAAQAIRDFGGFQQIHCFKHRKEKTNDNLLCTQDKAQRRVVRLQLENIRNRSGTSST
ncbi:AAA family ATPase [Pseudomonas mediterranea]|uniref:AAA family ATPase n=1 Tax=Pseudomonas mediterranea TaxID=183795 RepID=UPI001EEF0586|nr:AAA family ATPase [Pseudomonas mediterranea]